MLRFSLTRFSGLILAGAELKYLPLNTVQFFGTSFLDKEKRRGIILPLRSLV